MTSFKKIRSLLLLLCTTLPFTAGGAEVPLSSLLNSPFGRFAARELGFAADDSILAWLQASNTPERDLAAFRHMLETTKLRLNRSHEVPSWTFLEGQIDAVPLNAHQALRQTLLDTGADFLTLLRGRVAPETLGSYNSTRQKFIDLVDSGTRAASFRIKVVADRADTYTGQIFTLQLKRLRPHSAETHAPSVEYTRRYRKLIETLGFRVEGTSTTRGSDEFFEFPSVEALNSRLRLSEESAPDELFSHSLRFARAQVNAGSPLDFARNMANGKVLIPSDLGASNPAMFTRAIAVSRLMPRTIALKVVDYFDALVRIHDSPTLRKCKPCRRVIEGLTRQAVETLDRTASDLLETLVLIAPNSDLMLGDEFVVQTSNALRRLDFSTQEFLDRLGPGSGHFENAGTRLLGLLKKDLVLTKEELKLVQSAGDEIVTHPLEHMHSSDLDGAARILLRTHLFAL